MQDPFISLTLYRTILLSSWRNPTRLCKLENENWKYYRITKPKNPGVELPIFPAVSNVDL